MGNNNNNARDFGQWDPAGIYADTGCPVHPHCLDCPLPQCVYDLDITDQSIEGIFIRARNYRKVGASKTAADLAKQTGMTERSAFRIRRRYKESGGDYLKFILPD